MNTSRILVNLASDFAETIPIIDAEVEHDRWQAGIGPFEEDRQVEMLRNAVEGETSYSIKTGEPYLHAHHIHELSDGGSDTPDTVVGLCPNCHYRVHHGEDGDEYNQELLEIIQEKENSNEQHAK